MREVRSNGKVMGVVTEQVTGGVMGKVKVPGTSPQD